MGKLLICSLRCLITIQPVLYRYVTPLDLVEADAGESVTDTCVRKHGRRETFRMLSPSSVCPSSALMGANCRPGKWEWSRHRWSGDGREGGTQVIKRLSSDCYLSGSWLLQSTCQRVLRLDIELQIASNTMPWVCDWVWTAAAPEEQAAPTACLDVWAQTSGLLFQACGKELNPVTRWPGGPQDRGTSSLFCHWNSCMLFPPHSAGVPDVWWSRGYFSPVWNKPSQSQTVYLC